jgi:transcriptional regulator with XRE-family HTH domain
MEVYENIGRCIREYRLTAGMSQAVLADKSGLSAEFVSRVENGHRAPSVVSLGRVAEALGVKLQQLFQFDDAPVDASDARANRVAKLVRDTDEQTARKIEKMVEMLVSTP